MNFFLKIILILFDMFKYVFNLMICILVLFICMRIISWFDIFYIKLWLDFLWKKFFICVKWIIIVLDFLLECESIWYFFGFKGVVYNIKFL